jgi:hypothetical protein
VDTRDKISFFLPKTLAEKKNKFESKKFRSAAAAALFNPVLSKSMFIASRILSSRANTRSSDRSSVRIEVGFLLFRNKQAKHHHRVSKRRGSFATELQTKKPKKKHHQAYREQRHRVSSVDRFFAGREGHVRSSRNRFHGTLSLQAFGLGDRRFRAHVKGGLDDRSHFSLLFMRAVMRTMMWCASSSKRFSSSSDFLNGLISFFVCVSS